MRWMTRYLGFIAKPFIAWYAAQEVIACGLRSPAGQFNIIFSKTKNKEAYKFFKKSDNHWQKVDSLENKDFSHKLMFQEILPYTNVNETYKVIAKGLNGKKIYSSPNILMKEKTDYRDEILKIHKLSNGQVKISWTKAEEYNSMIFFLAVEDENDLGICGIYTKENSWVYPLVNKASLVIGQQSPPLLQPGHQYSFKLVIVDYDGWVPFVSTTKFIY